MNRREFLTLRALLFAVTCYLILFKIAVEYSR